MSAQHYVTLWCDQPDCVEFFQHSDDSIRGARRAARSAGWRYFALGPEKLMYDLCSLHRADGVAGSGGAS